MKVLMMPCGIGMGHTSRCIALAEKLREKNVEVVFASYGSGYKMLKEYGEYEICKLPDSLEYIYLPIYFKKKINKIECQK